MNHIPATISMAKLYEAQGYFQDSKEIYARIGQNPAPAKPSVKKTKAGHKKGHELALPSSLEIKIDQWVTLQLLDRQTESWKKSRQAKAEKTK